MFCRTILVLIAIFVCTAAHADQVVLQWDPNVEKELAGYILYYGNRSGDYPWHEDVGLDSRRGDKCEVTLDLPWGRWYFAVTAYDISGNESDYSQQVVGVVGGWIDKLSPRKRPPGTPLKIYGEGFGKPRKGTKIHIGSKTFSSRSSRVKRWSDRLINIKTPKRKCGWFDSSNYRKQEVWITVDGFDSNIRRFKATKPESCRN
jgi:hypothetical protein